MSNEDTPAAAPAGAPAADPAAAPAAAPAPAADAAPAPAAPAAPAAAQVEPLAVVKAGSEDPADLDDDVSGEGLTMSVLAHALYTWRYADV